MTSTILLNATPTSQSEVLLQQILVELRLLNTMIAAANPALITDLDAVRQDPYAAQVFPQP